MARPYYVTLKTDMTESLTTSPAWQALTSLAQTDALQPISHWFEQDKLRAENYSLSMPGLVFDYSKNRVSPTVKAELLNLATQREIPKKIAALFAGEKINTSEQRAVLHSVLRSPTTLEIDGQNLQADIEIQQQKMRVMSDKIRSGKWLGSTGKAITDVINIGIGGSDLGPKMVYQALREFTHADLNFHFISNVDGAEILSLLPTLNPETTLVIIASKTFTTQETLLNAKSVTQWFEAKLGLQTPQASSHFIGLTAEPHSAENYGIPATQILQFWDWVGGRYSVWSSIGLAIAIAIGYNNFEQFLAGASKADQHLTSTPLEQNIPVIMALLGVWYSNFLNAQSYAVIPYCERLSSFTSYLQQLDMESNGKSVSASGDAINYTTGPIVWGQSGTNGQHAFFQLLHQGSHLVPIDFIATINDKLSNTEHHKVLLGNMLAQAAALMAGQNAANTEAHKIYPGNKPSNILLLEELTPHNLGLLIALYEHKVFVQGAIWGINSFDQWGVELGKAMASSLLSENRGSFDASTERLFGLIGA